MECYNLFSENYKPQDEELRHEPPDIFLKDQIFDVKFSPTANVLALSQVTGHVRLFSYNEEANQEVLAFTHHKASCRAVEFSDDGNFLFTGSSDNSIGIITNGELLFQVKNAHKAPINKIKYIENNAVIATGDDDGLIKIWDFRISSTKTNNLCVATFTENTDTITDIVLNKETNLLLSTSNDGFLGVFDIRRSSLNPDSLFTGNLSEPGAKFKPSLYALSDNMDEELTSLCIVKNGKKVIVASQEGTMMLFSWDWFGDCNDRITAHPCCISTMVQYNEDIILTGCDDGYVRAVNILPNRIVAIINDDADEEDSLPVSKIALKNNFIAFTCNDEMVRIYDIKNYEDQGSDEEPSDIEQEAAQTNQNVEEVKEDSDADKNWEDLEDEMESSSDDDDAAFAGVNAYGGQDANWTKNKSEFERKKRQDFFSSL
ncbi:unnamed protein product [Moneuplotes crassus]|uniref:Uncharacterized protein n=2 Tax=Euplotes crassus TaxID=5936 RepID=A0AAD1US13_EUPCR|nr:unnamed protein product [Moneuplotes crassus]